jgi:hypothetical protein
MEPTIEITRSKLIAALAQWEADSKANNWPERADEERHADNADYLLELMGVN